MTDEQEEEQESPLEKGADEAGRFAGEKIGTKLASGGAGSAGAGTGAAGAATGTAAGATAGTAGGAAAGASAGAAAGSVVPGAGTVAGAAVGAVVAKFSKYIILAVVGAILIVVFLIAIILSALGIIGGGALDFGSPGGGLGIKDDYCQAYRSPEDLDGDGELSDCSVVLKGVVLEAAAAAKMPAAVLIAVGLSENLGTVMVLSEAEVTQYSEAGAELPGDLCDTSSAGAKGPMQFMTDTFEGHKDFIIDAAERPEGYTSSFCNIKDSLYAAAHKLKSDSIDPFDAPTRPWIDDEVIVAASSYLFGSPRTLSECDAESNYCTNVLNFYEDKKDLGVFGDPNIPNGCPLRLGSIDLAANLYGAPRSYGGHSGVDLQGGDGADVFATMDGKVEVSGEDPAAGYTVRISNGPYKSRYLHMKSDLRVSVDDQVLRGTVVGRQDDSGTSSSGSHLHYEVWENGVAIDPTPFIPIENRVGAICERGTEGEAVVGSLFEFEDEGDWSESDKDKLAQAISVPLRSETWKDLVFGAGKVKVKKLYGDSTCSDVCTGYVDAEGVLNLRPLFFTGLTDDGRVFVVTHELTHILDRRTSVFDDEYAGSAAETEFYNKGIIKSYPLCTVVDTSTYSAVTSCGSHGVNPIEEDFAEMAGNYVTDRDNYNQTRYPTGYVKPLDFPNEYPKHFEFARDVLFGGTTF